MTQNFVDDSLKIDLDGLFQDLRSLQNMTSYVFREKFFWFQRLNIPTYVVEVFLTMNITANMVYLEFWSLAAFGVRGRVMQ